MATLQTSSCVLSPDGAIHLGLASPTPPWSIRGLGRITLEKDCCAPRVRRTVDIVELIFSRAPKAAPRYESLGVSGVHEPSGPRRPRACVVCREGQAFPIHLYRHVGVVATTEEEGPHCPDLPSTFLCYYHLRKAVAGLVSIGWCHDTMCRSWGPMGGDSPCGRPFAHPVGWANLAG